MPFLDDLLQKYSKEDIKRITGFDIGGTKEQPQSSPPPLEVEPIKSEPLDIEPVKSDRLDIEPIKQEPLEIEPVQEQRLGMGDLHQMDKADLAAQLKKLPQQANPAKPNEEEDDGGSSGAGQPKSPNAEIAKALSQSDLYSPEHLRALQEQAQRTKEASQYSRLGEILASGISGIQDRGTLTKPVLGEVLKHQDEQADAPLHNYLQEIEMQKHDPKSSMSQLYRTALKRMKIEVPEGTSAASMEKAFPIIEKLTAHENALEAKKLQQSQADYYKQARLNLQQQGLDDRNTRLARTQLESLKNKIASGGGSPASQVRSAIISANRMFSTAGLSENSTPEDIKKLSPKQIEQLNSLSPQYVAELTLEMNKLLSGSTAPAATTFKKLLPRNIQMDKAWIESWLKSNPVGAEQAGFVKDMLATAARVKKDSNQYIGDLQKKYTTGTGHIKQYLPNDYNEVMGFINEKLEPESKSQNKGVVSKKVLSDYMSKHKVDEQTAVTFLKKAGFNVEGY